MRPEFHGCFALDSAGNELIDVDLNAPLHTAELSELRGARELLKLPPLQPPIRA